MGSPPRVSVIVPSYNHSAYIVACLESVLSQEFGDWELVVVDDCSTDGSFQILQEFAERDPRIRVFQNAENKGAYATEQAALELAQGSLIAVLNSDDLWQPSKLDKQVKLLKAHPGASFCYVLGTATQAAEDENYHYESPHGDWPTGEVQDLAPYLLYENRILASGVLFRRQGLRFNPTCRYSGDWVALLGAIQRGYACCVPEELTYWRQHATNSYRFSFALALEDLRVRRAIARHRDKWLSLTKQTAAAQNALDRNALNIYMDGIVFNRRSESLRAILPCFSRAPVKTLRRAGALLLPYQTLIRYPFEGKASPLSAQEQGEWMSKLAALPPIEF